MSSATPTRAERPHLRRASVRSSVARGWGKSAAADHGAVLVSGWRSAVTWRRLGDLVSHSSSVCSRRPPLSSSEPRSHSREHISAGRCGARRLYYILWKQKCSARCRWRGNRRFPSASGAPSRPSSPSSRFSRRRAYCACGAVQLAATRWPSRRLVCGSTHGSDGSTVGRYVWEVSSEGGAHGAWRGSAGGNLLAKPPPRVRLDAWQCRLDGWTLRLGGILRRRAHGA